MNPRNKRLLQCLIEDEKVFVKDLRKRIGALNPAQNTFLLRREGWKIQTGKKDMVKQFLSRKGLNLSNIK